MEINLIFGNSGKTNFPRNFFRDNDQNEFDR